jgi:hypothetical protein
LTRIYEREASRDMALGSKRDRAMGAAPLRFTQRQAVPTGYGMANRAAAEETDVDKLTAAALSAITGTTVLNCLGKQPCPPSLAGDLSHVLDLPDAVRADLWAVLDANMGAVNTAHSAAAVGTFCEKHGLDPRALTPVVGACRFLFQRGAERNTAPALMDEDLRQLLAGEKADEATLSAVCACLLPYYERAARTLRVKAIYEALTDHGRVITDVKWRVDNVSHANTGESINLPVTILTLRYREGEQGGQMTVQILPDELRKLLHACEQALR